MNIAFRPSPPTAPDAPEPLGSASVARVEVFDDLAAAEPAWRKLIDRDAVASPYQAYDWVRLWHHHVSPHGDMTPCVIVGYDAADEPVFLWPFVRDTFGPFRIATFFGGKHATINMALWRRDVADGFTAADMKAVLARVAAMAPDLDLLLLFNQPYRWSEAANPFALLPKHRSTEDNFVLRLGGSSAEILERELSSSTRSRLRNKEKKLQKLKDYRYVRARTAPEVDFQLASFFKQKAEKFTALGLHDVFADPGVEGFIRAACHEGLDAGKPVIELHALEADGEMLALFSGIHDGQRFTSNFNSHTGSDHARHSPGLILLQYLVADCADRGFASFDIGPGEARYKSSFCKDLEPIFDSVLPLSARGHAAALALRLMFRTKSAIKHNRLLWTVASFVRRSLNKAKSETKPGND
ncbi:MAG TPA: GNAT family N-acetyltransferase [Pseudorhodoplanes sp.]|nr:GNAT family N-acetyltransferase [Pseudorhodoplanes sp.]